MYLIFNMLLHLLVVGILLVIARIDAKTMTIPDSLNVALLACGIAAIFLIPEIPLQSRCIGLFCVSIPLFVITLVVPQSFGGGDVKLMAAAGFFLGEKHVLIAACIGFCIGALYGIYLLVAKKKSAQEHFAFGPALCAGITFALFFCPSTLSWHQVL